MDPLNPVPSRRRPIIGVMGAGQAGRQTLEAAGRLGFLIADAGWILLTGGRPAGVMDAASAGAKRVPGSLTIGILPSGPGGPVSEHVDIAIYTGLGNARNAINVLSSDVVVACGVEGPGTASEVSLALKSERPTVLLAPNPAALEFFKGLSHSDCLHAVATPEETVGLIERELRVARWRAEAQRT
jgi:uncharacterized protein (TIGR00725 family)